MFAIDDILAIGSSAGFERTALELFAFQAVHCPPFREYLSLIGVDPHSVDRIEKIPFLPVEIFKTHKVYCGDGEPEIVFSSSGTGESGAARHYVMRKSDYERTFRRSFELFYGSPADVNIYALLPGYLEREGSSLVYMIDDLIKSGCGDGFYLDGYERLITDMAADRGAKILFGVSYALWDVAERHAPKLQNTIVMETGGMKGRREELPKNEFHALLCKGFGVERIHSEYGMAELSSQAYSSGYNLFETPPWMHVLIRDLNDPFEVLPSGRAGGINIIDLANTGSCAFIQTQDIGYVNSEGHFSILGRTDRSDIRGCNLLIQ